MARESNWVGRGLGGAGRWRAVGLLLVAAGLAGPAAAATWQPPEQSATQTRREFAAFENVPNWGQVIDPEGDCRFEYHEGTFSICVPGAYHDLWPGQGKVNAPLVLQEVTGDFTVEVLVAAVPKPKPNTILPGLASRSSFHAGTLVIWQDAENFVRFDRTEMNRDGREIRSCYLHVFRDGKRTAELYPAVDDLPTHLKLQRRGNRLAAWYSQDGGRQWSALPEQAIEMPDTLRIGISAINNTTSACDIHFQHLKWLGLDRPQSISDEPST